MYNTDWSRKELNSQKLGAFGEYYAKMVMTSYGMDIYSSEVDDHGIDFVAETKSKKFLRFQVKTVRKPQTSYVFMREYNYLKVDKGLPEEKSIAFSPDDDSLYLILLVLFEGKEPDMYVIPATAWKEDFGTTFVYHSGYQKPEYGINLSNNNLKLLAQFKIENMVDKLL